MFSVWRMFDVSIGSENVSSVCRIGLWVRLLFCILVCVLVFFEFFIIEFLIRLLLFRFF